ncbi:MAG: UDP-N-acetylmuramoyl-tripeptide--D-alanyl-D-alanine ligase [Salibacteraceae bacterium]
MFFALKGDSFNGNDFALEAIDKGSVAAVVDEHRDEFIGNPRIFIVPNALQALQQLATHHRLQLKIPIIALTGSNGKTTTKELMKAALSTQYKTFATEGNLNNHIGVPLSLLQINADHEIAVIEMGANHQNEIAALCQIALPDYGLITNIGLAHLEGFGGEQGVFKGKKELFDFIAEVNKTAFVNVSDEKVKRAATGLSSIVTYGFEDDADFTCSIASSLPYLNVRWKQKGENEEYTAKTRLTGDYNTLNVLAAIAVARFFGVAADKINAAIEGYRPQNQRSEIIKTERGNVLIVDCYNANPTSMNAALDNLQSIGSNKTAVVLGDMLELGAESEQYHQKIVQRLKQIKPALCVLIGPEFGKTQAEGNSAQYFVSTAEAKEWINLQPELSGYTVLLKGSRRLKLEELATCF